MVKLVARDFEQQDNPWNGVTIADEATLTNLLKDSAAKDPFLLELTGDNGFRLTIGIGGPLGCVQYSSNNGYPPYLVALSESQDRRNADGDVEFLAGGTATPVPLRRCLTFEVLGQIVMYFFATGERSPEVGWEEV